MVSIALNIAAFLFLAWVAMKALEIIIILLDESPAFRQFLLWCGIIALGLFGWFMSAVVK